jgi:NADH dehydrogenase
LRDRKSLIDACKDIDVVISTATVVFPKGKSSFRIDEGEGYRNLVVACEEAGVWQVIFVSLAIPFKKEYLDLVPTVQFKKESEVLIKSGSFKHTIFRFPPFMDDYFALIGSEIPLVGEKVATLNRVSGLPKILRKVSGNSIERFGIAFVPGSKNHRHSFISVKDAAMYIVASIGNSLLYNSIIEIGGPESISWNDVCALYSKYLGRRIRVISLSKYVLKFMLYLFKPFSETVSNQMGIIWIIAENETIIDSDLKKELGSLEEETARLYLRNKVSLFQNSF